MGGVSIGPTQPGDVAALEQLYPAAFPDEDLLPLVRELLNHKAVLSLAASADNALIGHIAFTTCSVEGSPLKASLLAPLAVAPARQRQGVGSALIDKGLELLRATSVVKVCVLGDPNYYARSGFEVEESVTPPYPLPEEWAGAWRSLDLAEAGRGLKGRLSPPAPWLKSALWGP